MISYVSEGMSKQVSEKNYELSKLARLRNKILQSGNVVSIIVVSASMKSVNPEIITTKKHTIVSPVSGIFPLISRWCKLMFCQLAMAIEHAR